MTTLPIASQQPSRSQWPVGIWRSSKIGWVYAPKELGRPSERTGEATIMRFSSNGQFTMVYAAIIQETGSEVVSQGDSWTIFYGSWKLSQDKVHVHYSQVYRDIPMDHSTKALGEPPIEAELIASEHRALLFHGYRLIADERLARSFNSTFSDPPLMPKDELGAP